jgi:methionyl-tRNA formyltransferase
VTYAARIEKHETAVDWAQPAAVVHNHIRGLHPWPLASARWRDRRLRLVRSVIDIESQDAATTDGGSGTSPGTIIRLDRDAFVVSTGLGAVRILDVQTDGKPPMPVRAFLSGHHMAVGDRLEPALIDGPA